MPKSPPSTPRPRAIRQVTAAEGGGAPAQERELRVQGTQTMSRLLDAGRYVFGKRGYQATRVDDVVKRAKTSHGTFYLYYANKEDLFAALARQTIGEMTEVTNSFPAVSYDETGRAALHTWITTFIDAYERNRTVIRTWSEAGVADTQLARLGLDLLRKLSHAFAEQVRAADAGDVDADVVGFSLLSMIERTSFLLHSRKEVDREVAIDSITTIVFSVFYRVVPASAKHRNLRRA